MYSKRKCRIEIRSFTWTDKTFCERKYKGSFWHPPEEQTILVLYQTFGQNSKKNGKIDSLNAATTNFAPSRRLQTRVAGV
jgi:hypothetical protein